MRKLSSFKKIVLIRFITFLFLLKHFSIYYCEEKLTRHPFFTAGKSSSIQFIKEANEEKK